MTSNSAGHSPDQPITPREIRDAWMQVQGPDYASEFASNLNIPDLSALGPHVFTTVAPALLEFSKNMASVLPDTLPVDQLAGNLQVLVRAPGMDIVRKSLLASHAESLKGLYSSLDVVALSALLPQLQESLSIFAKNVAASVATSQVQSVLADATSLREKLGEQDVDELTDQFFASHPHLAESIEESPALYALSGADRRLIVWFIGIMVTLYVGSTLLNIGTENPELKAIIDAFGLDFGGGAPAGWAALKFADKALEKLPQEESE